MIAKRIACFYLLLKEVSIREISKTLKISTATVAYFSHYLSKSPNLKVYLEKKLKVEKVLSIIDDVFHELTTQPGIKIGHWQKEVDYRRKKAEPF